MNARTYRRRRRNALAALAAIAAVAGAFVGARAGEDGDDPAPAAEGAPPPPSCPPEIVADRRRLVGQSLIVRMEATATDSLRRRVRRGEIGGVILFPPLGTDPAALGREIATLRRAAAAGGMPPPLIAIDQEGGEVERLPDLAPDTAPAELGASADEAAALREGRATGRDLHGLGINVDLAPVLDVPASAAAFIAPRTFGRAARVRTLGLAFARGLGQAGVAATAKHFPGLGTATVNTDEAPSALPATRAELAPEIAVFQAAVDEGVPLVMVANATYAAFDPSRPASLSRRVIERELRERLGFKGVVITDDLGAGALTSLGVEEGEAAVSAAAAGADLLLFALSDGEAAASALVAALRRGALDRARLEEACVRTVALRERLG